MVRAPSGGTAASGQRRTLASTATYPTATDHPSVPSPCHRPRPRRHRPRPGPVTATWSHTMGTRGVPPTDLAYSAPRRPRRPPRPRWCTPPAARPGAHNPHHVPDSFPARFSGFTPVAFEEDGRRLSPEKRHRQAEPGGASVWTMLIGSGLRTGRRGCRQRRDDHGGGGQLRRRQGELGAIRGTAGGAAGPSWTARPGGAGAP